MRNGLIYVIPAVLCILAYGHWNYRNPQIEEIRIETDKEFHGDSMRIVAVSDVHLGLGTGPKALERYVRMINALNPDVILIAGDLIDNDIKPVIEGDFIKSLNAMKAEYGIFMVPGNHEYISGIDACLKYLKGTEIKVLRDEISVLPNGIQLIGRDDRTNTRRKDIESLIEAADRRYPLIVLDHQPYELEITDSLGADLQICGHTHRGQIWPLSLITDAIFSQSHGYRKWPISHIWVSSGLSLWGPPFRIGTDSDLAVIEISHKQ